MGFSFPFTVLFFVKNLNWKSYGIHVPVPVVHIFPTVWRTFIAPTWTEKPIPFLTVWPRSTDFGTEMDWFLVYCVVRNENDELTEWQAGLHRHKQQNESKHQKREDKEMKKWEQKKTEWNNTKLQPFYNGLSVRITESLKIERARQPSNPLIVKFLFSPNASTIEENRTEQSRAPLWSSPHSYTRTLIHLIYPSIPSW